MFLIELTGYDETTESERVFRFSTAPYITLPTDTPANTLYEPRVKQAGSIQMSMFSGGVLSGEIGTTFGEIIINNNDGELDYLFDLCFDGRDVRILSGEGGALSSFEVIASVLADQTLFEWNRVVVKLRSKVQLLRKALPLRKYQGDNVLPDGVEGTPDDIKGNIKPKVLGKVFNIPAVCVNTSKLIYQINDSTGFVDAIPNWDAVADVDSIATFGYALGGITDLYVYDKGVSLTKGTDYSDLTEMFAVAPAAGTFRTLPQAGLFRLGSSPTGTVTADCMDTESLTVAPTVANLVKRIVVDYSDTGAADLVQADIDAVNAANSTDAGIYINSDTNIDAVLNTLCASLGLWWGYDSTGKFRLKQINVPTGNSNKLLTMYNFIMNAELLSSDSAKKSVKLRWKKNYQVMSNTELAGAVTQDRKSMLSIEFRETLKSDEDVVRMHKLADDLVIDTALQTEPATEASRVLSIVKTPRRRLKLTGKYSKGQGLTIGDECTVQFPRYGYQNGQSRLVVGSTFNLERNSLELIVWG